MSNGIPAPFADPSYKPRFAVIRGIHQGSFLGRYLIGIRSMATELGIEIAVFDADSSQKMVPMVETAIRQRVDAIVISHGSFDNLRPAIETALNQGIRVVAFDVTGGHPEVPEIEQDDLLISYLLCRQIVIDYGGKANVIYINADGFAPLVKRDRIWQDFKWRYSGLNEVAWMGAVTEDTAADTQICLETLLQEHPDTNVVIAMWDEFAKGAARAITQRDLADQVKVYSVDITDKDIQMMTEPSSPWVVTIATDAFNIGRLAVRAAAALIAGERVDKYLLVEPQLITQGFLLSNRITNIDELTKALPTLGESRLVWFDWMERILARNGYQKSIATLPPEQLINQLQTTLTMLERRNVQLEMAVRAAEAASRAKSAFLASMSHELRTPLNAILGYAQIFKRRPLEPDVIRGLNIVQQSGEHLLTLINDILDIARIEVGRMELRPTAIHLPNFLGYIAGIIRSRAETKRLTFSFEQLSTLPVGVQADETRLRQVLLNLLDNAVKFTEAGHVTLRVSSKKYEVGSKGREQPIEPLLPTSRFASLLRFEVEDTGTGIAPDQLERIFSPFEQAGEVTRWTKGAGLGLAISHQLVGLMGSELHVQSEPGRGSTFWFEVALPVTEVAVEAEQPRDRRITGYQGPRRVVLVVDDIPSNRAVIIDLLEPLGFEMVEAVDGQQALHLARELRPDLILLDRWMPVMDGFEAAQQMRQIPELKEVPVVAISASVSEEDQARSRELGIDAFLPKPVNWPNLAALLEEQLGLEWEYEGKDEGGRMKDEEKIHPSSLIPQPSELVPPPQEELAVLHHLAQRGNMRAIREQAAHIETLGEQYVPFANRLHELARGFEDREILALIERHLEEDQ